MENSVQLKSDRLTVDIAKPGTIYSRTRFDWTGFITQVTLDGLHTFCMPEELDDSGCGGIGICNEFGILEAIGYNEAQPGEQFPKIGVGLLKRNSEKYNFWTSYELEPYKITFNYTKDGMNFKVEPKDCRGYAVLMNKSVKVIENKIEINYSLENRGTKPLETDEYSHNFLGINKRSIGPEYTLIFPYDIQLSQARSSFVINKNELSWESTPKNSEDFYCFIHGYGNEKAHTWKLINKNAGLGVSETDDFEVSKIALWGKSHVACPEIFIRINLNPGDKKTWNRTFEFFNL